MSWELILLQIPTGSPITANELRGLPEPPHWSGGSSPEALLTFCKVSKGSFINNARDVSPPTSQAGAAGTLRGESAPM